MGTRTPAGAWNIDFPGVSGKAPAGGFKRRLLNLNSHNHNQHAGQAVLFSCRPDRAFKVYSTLRYFPPPKPCITRQCACESCASRLLTTGSVNDGRTVVRPLKT